MERYNVPLRLYNYINIFILNKFVTYETYTYYIWSLWTNGNFIYIFIYIK